MHRLLALTFTAPALSTMVIINMVVLGRAQMTPTGVLGHAAQFILSRCSCSTHCQLS